MIAVVDQNGTTLSAGDFTNTTSVEIKVTEPGLSGSLGIGLASVVVTDAAGNTVSSANLGSGAQTADFFASGLSEGAYIVVAQDAGGIFATFPFSIEINYPTVAAFDAVGAGLGQYTVTNNSPITFVATQDIAPIVNFTVYEGGIPVATSNGSSLTALPFNPNGDWLIAEACDAASNCQSLTVGAFPPTSPNSPPVPPPPAPPAPPPGSKMPPPPPYPGGPQSPTLPSPVCAAYPVSCTYPPFAPPVPGAPPTSGPIKRQYHTPGDPNFMTGPSGSVIPGQLMTYTVQFENVGDAPALGVYVTDVLSPALDETTLSLQNMYTVNFSTDSVPLSQTATTFQWYFDPQTRTVTLFAGNSAANAGGKFVLQARLRSSAVPGTVIPNQAIIYFPNAVQTATPTNTILSAVPLPTQLAYNGASTGTYLSSAKLSARLTTGAISPNLQPITFSLAGSSVTSLTDNTGAAATTVALSTAAGSYSLSISYPGDGLYYLPSATQVSFAVGKKTTVLQAPFMVSYATATVQLTLKLTDSDGHSLQHQAEEPKTVYLETVTSSGTTTLASSLLAGTTVSFVFTPPTPYQQFMNIQARFPGDSRYASVISTGVLQLVDSAAPAVAILPLQSSTGPYLSGTSLNVNFTVQDVLDSAPASTAILMQQGPQPPISVMNGSNVPVSSLSPGSWMLLVTAKDWAGNQTSTTTMAFQVLASTSAPFTNLVAGNPSIGSDPIYVSSQTSLSLSASPGPQGVGVAQTFLAIDGSSFAPYLGSIPPLSAGIHILSFYSKDSAGNIESTETQTVDVDTTPPTTTLLLNGAAAVSTAAVINSTQTISFQATDSESGVAATIYSLDGGTLTSTSSPFTLPVGSHTLTYFSEDFVGNVERVNVAVVTVMAILDKLPPRTTLNVGAPSYSSGTVTFAAKTTPFALSAVDDATTVGDGVGSGVAKTFISIDSAPFAVYGGSFTVFATGPHVFAFFSVDKASNAEVVHSSSIYVDATPPTLTLSPITGGSVTSPKSALFAIYADTESGISQASVQIIFDGVSVATLAAVTTSSATYIPSFSLSQGTHSISAVVADNVGNVSNATSIFQLDSIPPITTLQVDGLANSTTNITLVSTDTIGFIASDSGSGVALTSFALDASSLTVYTSTFSVLAGTHTLSYRSVDVAGNIEATHFVTLTVRSRVTAPPSISLIPVNGSTVTTTTPLIVAVYVDTSAPLNLASLNLSIDGVNITTSAIVSASSVTYRPATNLSQGIHTVAASIADKNGNVTAAISKWLVDSISPGTTLTVDGRPTSAHSVIIVSTDSLGFVAVDSGTGVQQTFYRLDAATAAVVFVAPFNISTGTHTLAFYSIDVAGNIEPPNVALISVTAPVISSSPPIIASIIPSSAPIGAPFTLTGGNFGLLRSTNSAVLFNGFAAPISTWTNVLIAGYVPGQVSTGPAKVVVQLGAVQSSSATFLVLRPTILMMAPSAGPRKTGVMMNGFGFGPYTSTQTVVMLGAKEVPISAWTDRRIVWTVPAETQHGKYPVVVVRRPAGGSVSSSSMTFVVTRRHDDRDDEDALDIPLEALPPWFFEGRLPITAHGGGVIETPSRAGIHVAPGALYQNEELTIGLAEKSRYRDAGQGRDNLTANGRAISFGPLGLRTALPVTIELPISNSLSGDDPSNYTAIFCFNDVSRSWMRQTSWTDQTRSVVGARISELGICQPFRSPVHLSKQNSK